jgi:endoglucanase
MLFKIAAAPQAKWFGSWNTNVRADVDAATTTITNAGAVPLFVAVNIPQRGCARLGSNDATRYRQWIDAFVAGIGGRSAIVILEPDALGGMDCLSASGQKLRFDLLAYAVKSLSANAKVSVYLDAGNPEWQTAATMAARLQKAGIASAAGFALNVANFFTTSSNVTYGQQLSALVGGKHFVIDTGRNGLGPTADRQICNPDGRAIGDWPNTNPGVTSVDAYLWIKVPGESDGTCRGNPPAGTWMPEYALGLAKRATY